ncbi:MAG: GTP-dependent dephospho-CoA kinase family protein [Candidatus Micrarchaeota archaeon]|nr:GTP-dependent dephospho-CoA kinase family protein [Candidatus Micrarchaeota archaeon]
MKVITDELREELRRPFGKIVDDATLARETNGRKPIAVGDACAFAMLRGGIRPSLVIYDLKTKRSEVGEEVKRELGRFCAKPRVVKNEPGTISWELVEAVKWGLKNDGACIRVEGEEDLAALVVIIEAEDGGLMVYGQPDVGPVLVEINGETKARARKIYARMAEE